jgi:hypothetical protein
LNMTGRKEERKKLRNRQEYRRKQWKMKRFFREIESDASITAKPSKNWTESKKQVKDACCGTPLRQKSTNWHLFIRGLNQMLNCELKFNPVNSSPVSGVSLWPHVFLIVNLLYERKLIWYSPWLLTNWEFTHGYWDLHWDRETGRLWAKDLDLHEKFMRWSNVKLITCRLRITKSLDDSESNSNSDGTKSVLSSHIPRLVSIFLWFDLCDYNDIVEQLHWLEIVTDIWMDQ